MPARRPHARFHDAVRSRELGLSHTMPSIAPVLGGFRTTPQSEYAFWTLTPTGNPITVPPYSAAFSRTSLDGHALLVADEDGVLTILDTRRSMRDQMHHADPTTAPLARFRAHDNAIFDAVWLPDDARVATASGDASVRVFDPTTLFRVALCRGASGSVKCVRPLPSNPRSLLVSSGRDGAVRLHDLRVPAVYDPSVCREVFHKPVFTLPRAHAPVATAPAYPVAKRRRISADPAPASVTCVATLPAGVAGGTQLFTAGAADGTVKLWDLRASSPLLSKRCMRGDVAPDVAAMVSYSSSDASATCGHTASGSGRRFGIASLDVDPSGTRLLASSTDSRIHLYDANDLSLGHSRVLAGRAATSFYVRARFSPCGRFVASGSADAKAYLWDVSAPAPLPPASGTRFGGGDDAPPPNAPLRPFLELDGHRGGECSIVEWCAADPFKLVTCADDSTAKVWKVDVAARAEREREADEEPCGAARRVGPPRTGWKCDGVPTSRVSRSDARRFRDSDIRTFFSGSSTRRRTAASVAGGSGGRVGATEAR